MRYLLLYRKTTLRIFLYKKNRPQNCPPQTHFNYLWTSSNRPSKFVDGCGCFSKRCQNSPKNRRTKSRPAMNSPEKRLSPPMLSIKKENKIDSQNVINLTPPENHEKMTRYVRVRKSICYEVKATKKKCIYQLLCSISSSFQKLNQEISISKITTKNVARKFSKLKKNGYPFSKIHFKGSTDNKYKKPDSNRVASHLSPHEKIIKNFFL